MKRGPWWAPLFAPVDIASLVFFRIAFGALMAWEVWRYLSAGWVESGWVAPECHFTYYGFGWVKPWPGGGLSIHWLVVGLLAVLLAAGFCYRGCMALFFIGFAYIFLVEASNYLNHFYLICLFSFLMIFVPAHRALSVDAWWRPFIRSQTAPAWALWLLRFQLGIAYCYAGVAKLNADWLRGEPLRAWLAESTDYPVLGRFFTEEWMVYLFAYGGLLFDLLVVPLLLWRRTRLFIFLVAVFFHLSNVQLFSIGVFPWFSIAATTLFFPPDWPRRWIGRLRLGRSVTTGPSQTAATRSVPPQQKLIVTLIGLFAAWQVLMPLRHFLYPGNVSWTEEGHNFAWHMKLRAKQGGAFFVVTSRQGGLLEIVDPEDFLTEDQVRKMTSRPDLILQSAHFLAAQYRERGFAGIEVRANVMVSLNGRKPQFLVDPAVDLAAQSRNLRPKPWIMPLTEPLPPRRQTPQIGSDVE